MNNKETELGVDSDKKVHGIETELWQMRLQEENDERAKKNQCIKNNAETNNVLKNIENKKKARAMGFAQRSFDNGRFDKTLKVIFLAKCSILSFHFLCKLINEHRFNQIQAE